MKRIFLWMKCLVALLAGLWVAQDAAAQEDTLTLSLADCRRMALAHNEDLQRADNALRQAELDKAVAFAAYLPKLDASATGVYMMPDLDLMGMELQMHGMYMAGITLMQPLYAGGKIRAGNRLAEIGRDCAAENRRKVRMQVLADADRAYWTYIAVRWKVRLLDTYRRQMDTLHRQTQTGVAAGMATENDLLRMEARKSEIDYQWQKAVNGANLCRLSLCNVLGAPLETVIAPTDTVITLPDRPAPLDESIALRPELKLLRKQVEAAEQQVRSARADILPTVGLSAGYAYYGNVKLNGTGMDAQGNPVPFTQKFQDGIGLVMASVSFPLFHWGEGLKKVKRSKLDLANTRLDLQKNTRLLSIEVRQAVQNVSDSRNLVNTARRGDRQATENLRVMCDRYRLGLCTLTDLLDAQSQWQQARSNLIEAQTQYKINETEYLRVTGRLE